MFIIWRHLPPLASTLWNHSTRSDVDCWWQSRRSGVAADSTGHVSSSVSHVYNTGQGDVVYYPNVTGCCFFLLSWHQLWLFISLTGWEVLYCPYILTRILFILTTFEAVITLTLLTRAAGCSWRFRQHRYEYFIYCFPLFTPRRLSSPVKRG